MSLPRYKITMLALAISITTSIVGCSSNPKKEVVDTGPQSSEQVYIQKAEKALERGQYTDASKYLEAIETYYPTGEYAQQAQLELLYAKFQQKDYEGAIVLAERFIKLNPQHPNVDYAYYVRGVANMEQNYDGLIRYTSLKQSHRDVSYLKLAYQNFVDFIRRYPSSTYAVDAAQRMEFISNEIAESEMNAARFNLKRKAYIAAIERSQWIIEHYPTAPQVPEALATVSYGYSKIGDQKLAQQYADVLKLNHPELIKSDGTVNMRAASREGSWVNRATLGLFGRSSKTSAESDVPAPEKADKPSLLNRASFGLLDRPGREAPEGYTPANESLYDNQRK
jgi:outer membrane protein assembly factor BamD